MAENAKEKRRSGTLSKHDAPALSVSAAVGNIRRGKAQSLNQKSARAEKRGGEDQKSSRLKFTESEGGTAENSAEESKKVCYYICKARQADDKCIGHQITEKLLKALIMDQLHLFITQLSDRRKVVEEAAAKL